MHTDKNLSELNLMETANLEEPDLEHSLRWLLDMDLSEPEEKLFTVADDEYLDAGPLGYDDDATCSMSPLHTPHTHHKRQQMLQVWWCYGCQCRVSAEAISLCVCACLHVYMSRLN